MKNKEKFSSKEKEKEKENKIKCMVASVFSRRCESYIM